MENYSEKSSTRIYIAFLGAAFLFLMATVWISADSLFLHVTKNEVITQDCLPHVIENDTDTEDTAMLLPDLYGIDPRDARIALEDMGLTVSVRECDRNAEMGGAVISTKPQAGSRVKSGEDITLFVESGRKVGSVRCPDLYGMCRLDAIYALHAHGLEVGKTEGGEGRLYSSRVRSQSRLAGTFVPKGSSVDIVLETDTPPEIQQKIADNNINSRFNFQQEIEKHKEFWRKRSFRWHITRQDE